MSASAIQISTPVSFADMVMASCHNFYSKLWVQTASAFTIAFIVFCLTMVLTNTHEFFESRVFTAGAALGLVGLYLPIVLFVKCRIKYAQIKIR
ncbi:hypothetical protein MUGA111182_03185 [Mucilaginibacter galii]|uniref:hypothetical protein n=1 Tax=Mucilaginibacter galii TaxID=2005073 RepID=UPI00362F2A8D